MATNKILTQIESLELDSAKYGSDLNERLTNIDQNFNNILSSGFVKGDKGNQTGTYGFIICNDNYTNKTILNTGKSGEDIINMIPDTIGLNVKDLLTIKSSIVFTYENIDKDKDRLTGSLPYVYMDPKRKDININNENDDKSCVIYYDGSSDKFLKSNPFPTLYYDEVEEKFYWKIGGEKTNIEALGPKGNKGDKGDSIILGKISQSSNNNYALLDQVATWKQTTNDGSPIYNWEKADFNNAPIGAMVIVYTDEKSFYISPCLKYWDKDKNEYMPYVYIDEHNSFDLIRDQITLESLLKNIKNEENIELGCIFIPSKIGELYHSVWCGVDEYNNEVLHMGMTDKITNIDNPVNFSSPQKLEISYDINTQNINTQNINTNKANIIRADITNADIDSAAIDKLNIVDKIKFNKSQALVNTPLISKDQIYISKYESEETTTVTNLSFEGNRIIIEPEKGIDGVISDLKYKTFGKMQIVKIPDSSIQSQYNFLRLYDEGGVTNNNPNRRCPWGVDPTLPKNLYIYNDVMGKYLTYFEQLNINNFSDTNDDSNPILDNQPLRYKMPFDEYLSSDYDKTMWIYDSNELNKSFNFTYNNNTYKFDPIYSIERFINQAKMLKDAASTSPNYFPFHPFKNNYMEFDYTQSLNVNDAQFIRFLGSPTFVFCIDDNINSVHNMILPSSIEIEELKYIFGTKEIDITQYLLKDENDKILSNIMDDIYSKKSEYVDVGDSNQANHPILLMASLPRRNVFTFNCGLTRDIVNKIEESFWVIDENGEKLDPELMDITQVQIKCKMKFNFKSYHQYRFELNPSWGSDPTDDQVKNIIERTYLLGMGNGKLLYEAKPNLYLYESICPKIRLENNAREIDTRSTQYFFDNINNVVNMFSLKMPDRISDGDLEDLKTSQELVVDGGKLQLDGNGSMLYYINENDSNHTPSQICSFLRIQDDISKYPCHCHICHDGMLWTDNPRSYFSFQLLPTDKNDGIIDETSFDCKITYMNNGNDEENPSSVKLSDIINVVNKYKDIGL